MAAGAVVAGVVRTAEDFSALALNETLAKFLDLSTFAARDLVTSRCPPANPTPLPLLLQTVEDLRLE